MAETTTTHYGWTKPEIQHSPTTWGGFLNNDLDAIDALVWTNQQGLVPIGAVTMFAGATAPTNWLICDGRSLSTAAPYDKLYAVLGYAFGGSGANFNLPNLTQKFPLGAGPNALGSSGGNFSVTIGVANLPVHSHPFNQAAHAHNNPQTPHAHAITDQQHVHAVVDQTHTHGASQVAHSHGIPDTVLTSPGSGAAAGSGAITAAGRRTDTQQPGVTIAAAATGITQTDARYTNINATQAANANIGATDAQTISSTGGPLIGNTGSGAAMLIAPPWVALNYIVRYQ